MEDSTEHAILLEVREGGAVLVLLDQRQLIVYPADIQKTGRWVAPKAIFLKRVPLHGLEVTDLEQHEVASADWAD